MVLAVFVVINLFIAIVINNLEAAKREDAGPGPEPGEIATRLAGIRQRLAEVEAALRASKGR